MSATTSEEEPVSLALTYNDEDGVAVHELERSPLGEVDDYKEVRSLGFGGNGNCFLLERREDQLLRVCKVSRRRPEYMASLDVIRPLEARILQDILPTHDRILRIHDCIINPLTTQLYFDYCSGGDLQDLMDHYYQLQKPMEENFLWHCYLQLAEALAFLHTGYDRRLPSRLNPPTSWTSVIHCDIKPRNVFLRPTSDGDRSHASLVLGDFGSAQLEPGCYINGTPDWQPPEVPRFSQKGDVWAVGAIIHAMAHNSGPPIGPLPPWVEDNTKNWISWVCNPRARVVKPLGSRYSSELQDCLSEALQFDPADRSSSVEILHSVQYDINMSGASENSLESIDFFDLQSLASIFDTEILPMGCDASSHRKNKDRLQFCSSDEPPLNYDETYSQDDVLYGKDKPPLVYGNSVFQTTC